MLWAWLGRTPLHWACWSWNLDIVRFLVEECHCDPRIHDKYGNTPLHCACKGGSIDIVKFLVVDHHCDPACCGGWKARTPLSIACESGKLGIVKFLVEECHCDPSVTDEDGNTPLHCACEGECFDLVKFLIIDHHCEPACCGRWKDRTPACKSGKLDIVKFLVEECHCDPRGQDKFGNTPLHHACMGGSIDIVRYLTVNQNCDPACRGRMGRTPLHYACRGGELDIVKFLVEECYCNPTVQDWSGDTPLHLTTQGRHDVLLFLLSQTPLLKLVKSVVNAPLLQAFMKCRTEYPLESAFKIFVVGNHATGKTTLAKVIENEITSFFGTFGGQWRKVSKSAVVPLTAGIIPVSIESRRLGQIVVYDMAG